MKRRYFKSAVLAVFLRITALALAIWLLCMAVLTVVTARLYTELFAEDMSGVLENLEVPESIGAATLNDQEQWNLSIKKAVTRLDTYDSYTGRIRGHLAELMLPADSEYQIAAAAFSPDNEPLMMSGSDYLAFGYLTTGEYAKYAAMESVDPSKVAYIKLSALEVEREDMEKYKSWGEGSFPLVMRLTGYFEGLEFIPLSLDYGYKSVNLGAIEWQSFSEAEEAVGRELESIYVQDHAVYGFEHERLFELSKKGSGLGELLCELAAAAHGKTQGAAYLNNAHLDSVSMSEVLMVDYRPVKLSREDDPSEPMVYYIAFAMRAEPLKTAMGKLINVYIVSFAVTALLALLVFVSIKRRFIDPVQVAYTGAVNGWGYVSSKLDKPVKWKAAAELLRILRERQ